MSQRTFAAQDPAWASKTGKTWWYTHERTRRAYRRLARLARQGVLFTYLTNPDGTPADPPACATTNHVESINAVVRELLHAHRGASAYHQAVIAQWALLLRTPQPPTPTEVLTQWEHDGRPRVIGHFVLVLMVMKLYFIWLHHHFKLFGLTCI